MASLTTKEEKELLFKELCTRLPYNVMVQVRTDFEYFDDTLSTEHIYLYRKSDVDEYDISPYLRSMSSITEEERNELSHYDNSVQRTDFFYSHHIDCRFMIEKGLALAAPEDMYK